MFCIRLAGRSWSRCSGPAHREVEWVGQGDVRTDAHKIDAVKQTVDGRQIKICRESRSSYADTGAWALGLALGTADTQGLPGQLARAAGAGHSKLVAHMRKKS